MIKTELNHGGRLHQVAANSSIPISRWIDLSTGISPFSYPVEEIPASYFHQLPQPSSELIQAAQDYYAADSLLACAGSQPVIQLLPQLWLQSFNKTTRVWLPNVGYKEHQHAWIKAGFEVYYYQQLPQPTQLQQRDILIVINPNNPSGDLYSKPQLLGLANQLQQLAGWLVCDEAFLDCYTNHQQLSLSDQVASGHVFVLRSVGKFFGLAGIRLGFVCAASHWLIQIQQAIGPWSVNGPAQWLGTQCLSDHQWQQQQRLRLQQTAGRLEQLLASKFARIVGTSLFKTVYTPKAKSHYQSLLQQGIYVRLTDEGDSLRFGLPADNLEHWHRLEQAISQLCE